MKKPLLFSFLFLIAMVAFAFPSRKYGPEAESNEISYSMRPMEP